MKIKTLKVQTLDHTDVKGKKLHYVIISNPEKLDEQGKAKEVYINVGEKNYTAVTQLIED